MVLNNRILLIVEQRQLPEHDIIKIKLYFAYLNLLTDR